MLTATMRHIIWDRSPTLIVQNANLGFGLGPFYHYLLTPFYIFTRFNLVFLQSIGSILGIIVTYLIYLSGKEIGGKKLGYLSSLIYASSFLISLFDRRLFHLTLDPLLTAITLFSLIMIANKKYHFIPLLSLPIGFSFHADPSLSVLTIAIVIAFIYLRIPVKSKHFFLGLLILLLFTLPLIGAEIIYKGALIKPIIKSLTRPIDNITSSQGYSFYNPLNFTKVLGRTIMLPPSKMIENQFAYSVDVPPPLFSPLPEIIVVLIFYAAIIHLKTVKKIKSKQASIPFIMSLAFVIGVYTYNLLFKGDFYQHYFMVYFPVFALITGFALNYIYKVPKFTFLLIIISYTLVNTYTLLNSSVKYPLYSKINLVKNSLESVGTKQYSIHASNDGYIHGGGWTELYNLTGHPPLKSYWYDFWGWIYSAYSLYPGPIQDKDPEIIVLIGKNDEVKNLNKGYFLTEFTYKDIKVSILRND